MSQALNFDKFCGSTVENHPFSELKVGDSAAITKTVTIDDLRLFAAATGSCKASKNACVKTALRCMKQISARRNAT